jgi:hypothetical protein
LSLSGFRPALVAPATASLVLLLTFGGLTLTHFDAKGFNSKLSSEYSLSKMSTFITRLSDCTTAISRACNAFMLSEG